MIDIRDEEDFKRQEALTKPDLSKITRVEVIDNTGRAYTSYNVKDLILDYQDNNRILKIFIR